MRYIIYCRKSTDTEDKQLLSLDSQESELLEIAKRNDLEIVKTFRESMSAKAEGRPIFTEMIKMITSGKADAILCWKIDRLARNMVEGGRIIDLLGKGVIKEIRTYEGIHLPSDNVIMLAVHFGTAKQYVKNLSVDVKRGLRKKLSMGIWPSFAPLGYVNDKLNKTILVDNKRAKYIVRAFELYATGGYGVNEITAILYKEGLRTRSGNKVYRNQLERILKNPFYCGLMLRDEKLYEGKHKSLISKSTFDKINKVANDRSRPRPSRLFFPLRGFLKCESCNCLITASKKKGHDYYYCTNGKKICGEHKSYIRETYLYKEIAKMLENLHISDRKIELMYQSAKERASKDNNYSEQILDTLHKELESLTAKESKLLDIFLDEQISKEIYDKRILDLHNDQVSLKTQIKEVEIRQPSFTLEPVKNIFKQASASSKEFLEADDEQKREIIKNLLWNLTIKDKNIVNIQYKSPFDVIAKMPQNGQIYEMLRG